MLAPQLALTLLAMASAATAAAPFPPASYVFGGSSAVANITGHLNALCGNAEPYQVVGSQAGIEGFNNGTYAAAWADQPMTIVEDNSGVSAAYGKCTLPYLLGTTAFFVNTVAGDANNGKLKLTVLQSWTIYSTASITWAAFAPTSVISGPITRVCFSNTCESTFAVEQYWVEGGAAAQFSKLVQHEPNSQPLTPQPLTWCVPAAGTTEMCHKIANTHGAIGYAKVKVCNNMYPHKFTEVALQNAAGNFVLASISDPTLAIPRVLPANCGASWSSVGAQMIFAKGNLTPPIVNFQYAFLRSTHTSAGGGKSILAKTILLCFLVYASGTVVQEFNFYNVPASTLAQVKAAIKSTT